MPVLCTCAKINTAVQKQADVQGNDCIVQAGRPDMDLSASGGQIVDAIVKLLCDEEALLSWNR